MTLAILGYCRGVFSTIDGSTTTDKNCAPGADSGAGVSSSVEWNSVYGCRYDLEVRSNGSLVWVSTVIDTRTGAHIHIGSYKVPASTGGIQDYEWGFVEWWPWNTREPPNHCVLLPYQKTIFGNPYTTHPLSIGLQSALYEYGDCVDKVAFKSQEAPGGMENIYGFKGMTGTNENVYFAWWRKMVDFVSALQGIDYGVLVI